MKVKYFSAILLAAVGLFTTSCEEEVSYTVNTDPVVTSITTGDAVVTAVSADIQGTVKDLSHAASQSYEVGVVYGTTQDPTTSGTKVAGSVSADGVISATLKGLETGKTYYYATYATLQKKLSYYGEVKSFVATQAVVTTADAASITASKATFAVTVAGAEGIGEYETGVKIATSEDAVRNAKSFVPGEVASLLPGTTYYYAGYAKIGSGYVYGETKAVTTEKYTMEYVDLGLSVLWAKCNLGAEAEQEAGALFGFGDLTAMQYSTSLEDYATGSISGTSFDVASALGIDGEELEVSKMPTKDEIAELIANTTQEPAVVEGVAGVRFTAANGNSIFLPAAGYRQGAEAVADGKGYYWSGDAEVVAPDYATTLVVGEGAAKGSSLRNLGLSIRSVRKAPTAGAKLLFVNKDGDGVNGRIELYNEFGPSKDKPAIDPASISFDENCWITFEIAGIDGNLKDGAAGSYIADPSYAAASWDPFYWGGNPDYQANVTGDGTYTVHFDVPYHAEGTVVFCIELLNIWADLVAPENVKVKLVNIEFDRPKVQPMFINKDDDGVNARIELYNEYGPSKANPCIDPTKISFDKNCYITFELTGIDGNLKEGAAGSYTADPSYAAASWDPSYWGGNADYQATVTGDGTYTVHFDVPYHAEGTVVFCVELPNLWADLVAPENVKVKLVSLEYDK